ncbi:MAG: glycyl-radical enzyme activating protein [Desulfatitalea sp.]|nr:glycyl-radical enzyme activating protein [Desulfatitalea sp.]NNK00170.1 glycyl-radical enzyme activating protein [Desulfatitalea sp.]
MSRQLQPKTDQGVVFNIQRYSIHDGPGIRTTVFLKGCPLRCFWCQNPESHRKEPQVSLNSDACALCGRCVSVCPTDAISLGTKSSAIDRDKCSGCGKCVQACPNDARSLAGTILTVDEVMRQVFKDVRFYENSGGGVTLSGGEPLYQADFALSILQRCKDSGLHTTIETCGCVSWDVMKNILEYTDLVFFDIKHLQPARHLEGCGKSNSLILANAKKVAECKPIIVRVPLIPGFNDSSEAIAEIAQFVKTELGAVEVELLPYNKMGEVKFERLDKKSVAKQTQGKDYLEGLRVVVADLLGSSV